MLNEIKKICLGMVFSFLLGVIIEYFTKVNEKEKEKLNNIMRLNNRNKIIKRQ